MNNKWIIFLVSAILVFIFPYAFITSQHENLQPISTTKPNNEDVRQLRITLPDNAGGVTTMAMDDYLTAVLLCEMPVDFNEEALKAQAVVARTYALRRVEKKKHDNYDVCTDSACCQGYLDEDDFLSAGGKAKDVEKVRRAVTQTKGTVITYEGSLIDATYFSCSGGMTEAAVAVWGKDVPYLQATNSPGEEIATYYSDEVRYDIDDLLSLLSVSTSKHPYAWVENVTYTVGGGVDEITICGKVYKGVELRKLLNLRSTAFTISFTESECVITTRGFGHRVGMSQYGAEAMAQNGATYVEILRHYFKGVELCQYTSED